MDAVAIIPARGGSRRVPRKNIRSFLGVPLISRTIATLLGSGVVSRVVVSTDDRAIAGVATDAGAEIPFLRESRLADDFTPTADVVVDAIQRIDGLTGDPSGPICVAYPAAVFATGDDLRLARAHLEEGEFDIVFSGTEFPAPIRRAWHKMADGSAEMIWPEYRLTRSQDLEPAFHDAGQFYWAWPGAWERIAAGQPVRYGMYEMPNWRVRDIDTEEDWEAAEHMYRLLME